MRPVRPGPTDRRRTNNPPFTAIDLRPAPYGVACVNLLCDVLAEWVPRDTVRRHEWVLNAGALTARCRPTVSVFRTCHCVADRRALASSRAHAVPVSRPLPVPLGTGAADPAPAPCGPVSAACSARCGEKHPSSGRVCRTLLPFLCGEILGVPHEFEQ